MKKYAKLLVLPVAVLGLASVNAASYTLNSDPINITVGKNETALPAPANKTVYISLSDINSPLNASNVKTTTTGLTSYVTATLEGTAPVPSDKCTLAKTIDSSNSVCYVADIANTTYTPTADQIAAAKNAAYAALSDDAITALGSCTQEQVVAETTSGQTCYNETVANATHTATAAETAAAVEAAYNAALNTTVKLDTTTGTDGSYTADITAVELGDNATLTIASGKTIEVSKINAGANSTIVIKGTLKGDITTGGEVDNQGVYNTSTYKITYTDKVATPTITSTTLDGSKVKVEWTEVAGADVYLLRRSLFDGTKCSESYTTLSSSITKTSYTDSSVSAGKTYCYFVAAKRNGKSASDYTKFTSGDTVAANYIIGPVEIAAPTKLTSAVTYKSVKLTTSKVNGATGYLYFRSTDKTNWDLLKASTSTSYTDETVEPGIKYYYTVVAYVKNSDSDINFSNALNDKALNGLAANFVTDSTVTGKAATTDTALEDKDVVKAEPKLAKASIAKVTNTSTLGKVKVTINKVTGAKGYIVYKNGTKFCDTTSTTCTPDVTLTIGANNKFVVIAYRDVKPNDNLELAKEGKRDNGSVYGDFRVSDEVEHVIAPEAPKLTKSNVKYLTAENGDPDAEGSDASIKVTPKAEQLYSNTLKVIVSDYAADNIKNGEELEYVLYKATSKNGTYKKVNDGQATRVFYVDGLKPGKTYYFKAKVRVNGKLSAYSSVQSKEVKMSAFGKNTDTLKKLEVTNNDGASEPVYYNRAIKLTGKRVEGATGYVIYRATSKSGKYTAVKTILTSNLDSGDDFEWKNTKLTAGTKYYYKVRAYKTVNSKKVFGKYSSIVSATAKLKAPEDFEYEETTKTTVKLSWSKVTGANGYRVYTKDGDLLGSTTGSSITIKGLDKNTGYEVYVRAYATVKGSKKLGAKSTTVSFTTNAD